jgi:hypothetical protein
MMADQLEGDLLMIQGPTSASLAYDNKKKTGREKFLEEMDQVIPWEELLKIIRKHYAKKGNGRQPMHLERMLRIYYIRENSRHRCPAV